MGKKTVFVIVLSMTLVALLKFFKEEPEPISYSKINQIKTFKKSKTDRAQDLSEMTNNDFAESNVQAVAVPDINSNQGCFNKLWGNHMEHPQFLNGNAQVTSLVGEWFYNPEAKPTADPSESSVPGKFFEGLARAGLLDGIKSQTRFDVNLEAASRILYEVARKDPDNSAPWLYLAQIEKKRGNSYLVDLYLEKARETSYFDSYVTSVSQKMMTQVKNPAQLAEAYGYMSRLPVPNYYVLKELLVDSGSVEIARQLVQDGLSDDNTRDMLDYVAVEYSAGAQALKHLGVNDNLPSFNKLFEYKNRKNPLKNAFRSISGQCDTTALQNAVGDIKQKYRN